MLYVVDNYYNDDGGEHDNDGDGVDDDKGSQTSASVTRVSGCMPQL